MNWTRTSDSVWLEEYRSEDGRWLVEPYATSEATAPEGWGVIDQRDDSLSYVARFPTVDEAKAYAEKESSNG